MDFFSVEGERLGSKLTLEDIIHEITGICVTTVPRKVGLSLEGVRGITGTASVQGRVWNGMVLNPISLSRSEVSLPLCLVRIGCPLAAVTLL